MQFTVDHFISKFEAIPDSQWRDDGQYGEEGQPKCAIGHCEERKGEADALRDIIRSHRRSTIDLNDGKDPLYKQPTPKLRILAALRDIKAKQI